MEDEKMIRAMLAGHVYAAALAHARERRAPGELLTYDGIAREAVIATDALLVELKKDSPAPARESAPPLADEARALGSVTDGDGSDARSAAADAPPADGLHEHRLGKPDDAEVVARSPLSFESQAERFRTENPPDPPKKRHRCAGLNKAARTTCNSPSVHVETDGKWFCKRHNPRKPKKARAA